MANLRGYELMIERSPVGEDPLNERASAILRAIPVVGPIHHIRLDAWADGSLELSLWADEERALALWEGKIIINGRFLDVETREATEAFKKTSLLATPPPPARPLQAHAHTSGPMPEETPEERAARHKLNEPLIAEFQRLRAEMGAEPLILLPLAPPADPLAEFRDLAPGAPLYDRASNRQIGAFEEVSGDCVRLRSSVTGHTVISSGRSITRHERPVYEAVNP